MFNLRTHSVQNKLRKPLGRICNFLKKNKYIDRILSIIAEAIESKLINLYHTSNNRISHGKSNGGVV